MPAKHASKLPSIKRPVGRPTLYPQTPAARRKLLDAVIEYGEQGCSQNEIAVKLGVDRGTMKGWANPNHGSHVPEFSTVLARATQIAEAYFEEKIRNGGVGHDRDQIHPSIFRHVLATRFRSDYGERDDGMRPGQGQTGAKVQINYIMAPGVDAPPVQLHSDAVTIDAEGDES